MVDYKIQFNAKSVCRTIEELLGDSYGRDPPHNVLNIQHQLLSPILGSFSRFSYLEKLLLHKQQEITKQIISVLNPTIDYLVALVKFPETREEAEVASATRMERSQGFVKCLIEASKQLPLTEKVMELGDISELEKDHLREGDYFAKSSIYTYNAFFSRNFQKETCRLNDDVMMFWADERDISTGVILRIYEPDLPHIETKEDYLTNVFLPLVDNLIQHSQNPDNDIYARLNDKEARYKSAWISYEDDEKNQEVIVRIRDAGFGMREEIQKELLQKIVSTKEDTQIEHGIGLLAVKGFVEKFGGKIWFETELGKGTSFYFTIPYTKKEGLMYIQ